MHIDNENLTKVIDFYFFLAKHIGKKISSNWLQRFFDQTKKSATDDFKTGSKFQKQQKQPVVYEEIKLQIRLQVNQKIQSYRHKMQKLKKNWYKCNTNKKYGKK